MKPYCDPYVTGSSIWNSKSAESLIKEGHCPAWVLASKPVLGRCMPAADPLHQDTYKANTARPSSQFKTVSTLYTSYFKAKYKQMCASIIVIIKCERRKKVNWERKETASFPDMIR